ncbi:MAG: zinc-ribbon domain-containing protein [Isosphaeraceae bacterium]
MFIRCPNCGRKGHLPDHLAPEANSLRCRRCRANFPTPELARRAPARDEVPASVPADGFSARVEAQGFLTDGYFRGYDDAEPGRSLGPGDSNYELIFTLRDAEPDAGDGWEADPEATDVDIEAPSCDEIPALAPTASAASGLAPWHHRFIESWGLLCVGSVVAMIAVMVPLEGYLIWRSLEGGSGTALPAMVGGLACVLALLLVSLPLLLLATSLPALVRDIRGLREQLERGA